MSWTADTPTQGTYGSTAPFTVAHTCSANAKLLVVVVFVNGTTARAGGALTYNGATMTDSGQGFVFDTGGECGVEIWYLIDPDTGSSYTVSAPNTGTAVNMNLSVMSFVPSAGGAAYDNSNKASGTTQNPSLSLTVSATGNLIVGGLGSGDRDVPTAGTNFTLIHTDDAGNQTWGSEYDLAGTASPVTVAFGTARGDDWGLIGISFKEAVGNINISSISDGATVADSPTLDPIAIDKLTASDGATLGDTPTMLMESFVASSDGATVGDAASIDPILLEINTSDGATVADAPTLDPIAIDTLTASDGITLGDSGSAAITGGVEDLTIDVADGVTLADIVRYYPDDVFIGESVAVEIAGGPTTLAIDVSDDLFVSDGNFFGIEISAIAEQEDVTLGESATIDIQIDITSSDGLAVADSPTVQLESPGVLSVSVSDDTAIGESVTLNMELEVASSDGLSIVDSPTVTIAEAEALSISVSDNVSVGESVSLDIGLEAISSDSVSLGDNAAADLQVDAVASDGAIIGESASVHIQAPWYNAEDLVINTGSIVSGTVNDTWTDNGVKLQLAEVTGSPGFSYDFYFYDVPAIAAEITFNGYYTGIAGHFKKIRQYNFNTTGWTDLTGDLDDFPPAGADYTVQFPILNDADYNSGGEIRLRIIHTTGGSAAHYLFIDQLLLGTNFAIHVNDNLNVGDSSSLELTVGISTSDDVAVGDSATADLQIDVSEQDFITVSDVDNVVMPDALKISVSDGLTIGDSATVVVQVEGELYVTVADGVTVGESESADVSDPQIIASDSVSAGESTQEYIGIEVSATDALTVGESATVYFGLEISASDDVAVADSAAAAIAAVADISINVSDDVAIGDTAQADVSDPQVSASDALTVGESATVFVEAEGILYTSVSDNVGVADSASADVSDPQVVASDNLAVGDVVTVFISEAGAIDISVSDNANVSDSTSADVSDPQIIASESLSIGESAIVQIGAAVPIQISVSDSLVIADAVQSLLGIDISGQDNVIVTDGATAIVYPVNVVASDGLVVGETLNVVSVEIAWVIVDDFELHGGVVISDDDAYNVTVVDYET